MTDSASMALQSGSGAAPTGPAYMADPRFLQLRAFAAVHGGAAAAARLGVSAPTVYQILNASGLYGKGLASPERIFEKVRHQLGSYACPHLSEEHGEPRVITSDECRAFAHRTAPTGSPRSLAHWQACRSCPHAQLSAPPQPRVPVPRKSVSDPASTTTTPEEPAA